jgi:hypothetical protein
MFAATSSFAKAPLPLPVGAYAKFRQIERNRIAAAWHSSACVGQSECLLWVEN